MSTIIQIKRNSGTTAPTTSDLVIGEMAYAYDASNDGASAKLYIEATNNASAADVHIIGGKYFTVMNFLNFCNFLNKNSLDQKYTQLKLKVRR